MIDAITRERIVIESEGTLHPYLMLPEEQLERVTQALTAHHIKHWVDEDTISIDGEPAVAIINLSRSADVTSVQRLLDEIQ